ncbi:MAG: AMP-binding protein [Paludibacteraceae bacterium]|nr:AMP-binding protein [Paludibacteraceae bacterium]
MLKHLFSYYNDIFPRMWEQPALSDYQGDISYTYQELAQQLFNIKLMFAQLGIKEGDKIALCGRNCANWAVAYLAIAVSQNVIVSILQDFNAKDIIHLVNHSDAKALFVGPYVWKNIAGKQEYTPEQIAEIANRLTPNLKAIISLKDFSLIYSENPIEKISAEPVKPETFHLKDDNLDDLMLINYTSGSTGAPKGVMLTYRSLSGNIFSGMKYLPPRAGDQLVSMLPLAHAFGQLAEFLFPLAAGVHIHFLAKTPTPTLLMKAFAEIKPYMIVTVPLVIEKICNKSIFPITNKSTFRLLWKAPLGIGRIIKHIVKNKLLKAFGGNLRYFIVGGAAVNPEVEKLLLDIHFPFIVGYGMTECGPLIGGCYLNEFEYRSCGHQLPYNEVKIDSEDPENIVGEILVKGDHVMKGYYKNEEATKAAFTDDGWLRTGDLGLIDKKGNIFIKGRNKNMILGASGQNIYPEEIEDKLNNMTGVAESVIVEREGKLVALVFPELKGELTFSQPILDQMKENLQKLNAILPKYSQIFKIELQDQEFEKTPKKSIKRFLYK